MATRVLTARRVLRFESIDAVLTEVDRLASVERQGRLRASGNWSGGQVLNHLAAWVEYAYTGTPMKTPWLIRLILRLRRSAFLNKPMPAGVRIPGVAGGTLATEPAEFATALARYRAALDRLKREAPTLPHQVFGPMPHEDWIKINLRHAELHLGYLSGD